MIAIHLVLAAFNAFDYKGDGYIRTNDIRKVLPYAMDDYTEQEDEDFMKFFR